MANPDHLAILKQGVDVWNKWREDNPDIRPDLREIDLTKDNIKDTALFIENTEGANLERANLRFAKLQDAKLLYANLRDAKLYHVNFENTDLRGVKGLKLHYCKTRNASFSPNASDPWSVLRRHYTGPKVLFTLLFLIAFFLPFVAKTIYWTGVNRTQTALKSITKNLEREARTENPQYPKELLTALSQTTRCLKPECKDTNVLGVVLGYNNFFGYWFLGLLLILYNFLKALLTWQVGPLREQEERSGYSPMLYPKDKFDFKKFPRWLKEKFYRYRNYLPWFTKQKIEESHLFGLLDCYGWLIPIHKTVTILFYLSAGAFIYNAWHWLAAPVSLPM